MNMKERAETEGILTPEEELLKEWAKRCIYWPPKTSQQRSNHERVNNLIWEIGETLVKLCPQSEELKQALQALVEAKMHANSALAIHVNSQEE